jgi:Na+/melibiose symporter-like transporter
VPKFYAEELGAPLQAVGLALLLVRVIDAFSDPLAGHLADGTRSRFGRRRIWVALAVLPTALAGYLVFVPPADAGAGYLFLWGTALSLAWTAMLVPYNAWGAELSSSYAGRTRVMAFRETLVVLGTFAAIALAGALQKPGSLRPVLDAFALVLVILLPVAALACLAAVPEPVDRSARTLSFREGLPFLKANRPFQRLLAAFFFNGLANGLPATLFLFYVGRVLGAEAAQGPLLVLYFLCGVIGVPFWLWLSKRIGKHRSWCYAMILACAGFLPAVFLDAGAVTDFAIVCIVTGLALGADMILPGAQQADVIDLDTAESGSQRSGLYLAFWGLATKLALALAVGLAFPLLGWAGFDAQGKSSTGLGMLAFLYAGLPVLLKLVAIGLMWNFPVDAATQERVRGQIEGRLA